MHLPEVQSLQPKSCPSWSYTSPLQHLVHIGKGFSTAVCGLWRASRARCWPGPGRSLRTHLISLDEQLLPAHTFIHCAFCTLTDCRKSSTGGSTICASTTLQPTTRTGRAAGGTPCACDGGASRVPAEQRLCWSLLTNLREGSGHWKG